MKKLILILMLLAGNSEAANLSNLASVALSWDRSPDDQLTNGMTYKVYAGTNLIAGNVNSLTNAFAGTNNSVIFTNLPAATWFFQGTAIQGGVESLPSNYSSLTVPAVKPRPPGNFGTMYLEVTLDLTNYTDLGMFRARIFVPKP